MLRRKRVCLDNEHQGVGPISNTSQLSEFGKLLPSWASIKFMAWAKLFLGFILRFFFQISRAYVQDNWLFWVKKWNLMNNRVILEPCPETLNFTEPKTEKANAGVAPQITHNREGWGHKSQINNTYDVLNTYTLSGTPAATLYTWSHFIFINQPKVLNILVLLLFLFFNRRGELSCSCPSASLFVSSDLSVTCFKVY